MQAARRVVLHRQAMTVMAWSGWLKQPWANHGCTHLLDGLLLRCNLLVLAVCKGALGQGRCKVQVMRCHREQ